MTDSSAADALARLEQTEPDIAESINQLVATRDSPGFLVLLKYLDELAKNANVDLVEADALDKDAIVRLQDTVKRFNFYAEAPDELIRGVLAKEIAAEHDLRFIILQTDCPQEVSIRRILSRTREDYQSNALTEQAYLNNKRKFEAVDLDALKKSYPNLEITHLAVDTTYDPPEDWYIISEDKR